MQASSFFMGKRKNILNKIRDRFHEKRKPTKDYNERFKRKRRKRATKFRPTRDKIQKRILHN